MVLIGKGFGIIECYRKYYLVPTSKHQTEVVGQTVQYARDEAEKTDLEAAITTFSRHEYDCDSGDYVWCRADARPWASQPWPKYLRF